MKILALDSTAKVAAVAICEDEKLLASFVCDNGLTHSEILLPMAEDAMKRTKIELSDIELFACNAGPGSFTGVRIGASVIKGLAFGRDIPCIPVSTLDSLAQNLFPLDGIYCPVMDARRNQVYNTLYRCENGVLTKLTDDRAISLDDLATELCKNYENEKIYLSGDGYALAFSYLEKKGVPLCKTPSNLIDQNAHSTAVCALRRFNGGDRTTDSSLSPTYLRMPSAERERLEKLGALQK